MRASPCSMTRPVSRIASVALFSGTAKSRCMVSSVTAWIWRRAGAVRAFFRLAVVMESASFAAADTQPSI